MPACRLQRPTAPWLCCVYDHRVCGHRARRACTALLATVRLRSPALSKAMRYCRLTPRGPALAVILAICSLVSATILSCAAFHFRYSRPSTTTITAVNTASGGIAATQACGEGKSMSRVTATLGWTLTVLYTISEQSSPSYRTTTPVPFPSMHSHDGISLLVMQSPCPEQGLEIPPGQTNEQFCPAQPSLQQTQRVKT
eukprot:3357365-Rhodomonas_salina.2